MSKKVKTQHDGERLEVCSHYDDEVAIDLYDIVHCGNRYSVSVVLSPKQARRLARELLRIAR